MVTLTATLDTAEPLSDADVAELTAQLEQALLSLWKVRAVSEVGLAAKKA